MKLRVVATLGATGLACAAALAGACGGRVLGSLDDAGVFHGLDGGVLFGPGSACIGYEAAAYIAASNQAPTCTDTREPSPPCVAWALEAGVTFGYQPYLICEITSTGDAEVPRCTMPGWLSNDDPLAHCDPGPEGDAYCQAFAQQFVLRGRAAPYICSPDPGLPHTCMNDRQTCNLVKGGVGAVLPDGATTPGNGFILQVSVADDDGGYRCEPICLPP